LRNRIVQEWQGRDHPPPHKVVPDSELPVIGRDRFLSTGVSNEAFLRISANSSVHG
jgi:hypothetical protein